MHLDERLHSRRDVQRQRWHPDDLGGFLERHQLGNSTDSQPSGATTDLALTGVACTSSSACTAVGTFTTLGSFPMMLAERWDGTSWALQTIPNPPNATDSGLAGVSCTATSACTAVGTYRDLAGNQLTLAKGWNGTSWTIQPAPTGATGSLTGVSCTSASACTAIIGAVCTLTCGVHPALRNIAGTPGMVAERWNGTSWAIQSIPNPTGGNNRISCRNRGWCHRFGRGGQSPPSESIASAITAQGEW